MFSPQDYKLFTDKEIDLQVVQRQIDHFIQGFPYIRLARPAVSGDGILRFNEADQQFYSDYYDKSAPGLRIVKFVPASGAASRMFKLLFEFVEKYQPGEQGKILFMKDQGFNSVHYFITHLRETAFYPDLKETLANAGSDLDQLLKNEDYTSIIEAILLPDGLNYASLPKALLKFHIYAEGARTAAEEHLVEAANYTKDKTGTTRIHFTISPEHRVKFTELFNRVKSLYEKQFSAKFEIAFSNQKPSTDIIAVDELNQPVRNADGSLLFRPGGHGALLENLNELDAEVVFIKNIDNIVPDHLKPTTYQYKKLLGGYLLFLQEKIFGLLHSLKTGSAADQHQYLADAADFARNYLFQDLPADFHSLPDAEQALRLFSLLNRPLRVCGMVKNEGEPGGGPFWVTGSDQKRSLQIVESSQVDMNNPAQREILEKSTHFNPVDLVCSTRDFEGKLFNLKEFVDENTGFISLKSSGGKTLKAQELPGLWNGAMARWITIFIEVPIITFNPVKTVNDLLRNEHLPKLK